jgi:DNA-directed RNA polymerase subunit M/transcription elongation factor TFIIS
MSIEMINNDIISPIIEGEIKMLQIKIKCPNPKCGCVTTMHYALQTELSSIKPFLVRGILKCGECGHERPLIMDGESIKEISAELPGQQSNNLDSKIAEDIKGDIVEAERALFNQCYKASVVMCRRALQLTLIDMGIENNPLQKMLIEAKPKFTEKTFAIAGFIKGFGDIGAHRREAIELDDAKMTIYTTVKMLNELSKYITNK